MTDSSTLATQVLNGNAIFANNLYQLLCQKDGNLFFSPVSIHVVLSMIYQGAGSRTADVLAEVLRIPDAKSTSLGYKSIMERLNALQGVDLSSANKIYVGEREDKKFQFIEEFRKVVSENFHSEVEFVNFSQKKRAVETINAWVEAKTKRKIRDLINEDFIDESTTAMMLINAIYFKGDWKKKFDKTRTIDDRFYLDNGETIKVKMMYNWLECGYKFDSELNAQIVSLPYKRDEVDMVIVLPYERNGIKDLETKLASSDLLKLMDGLRATELSIVLPKFKMEETMDLGDVLSQMGLASIFDIHKAHFPGIVELKANEKFSVDKVVQKTFMEVNEEGTEAAVATVVTVYVGPCMGRIIKRIEVRVDHPAVFMLVTYHHNTKDILFLGRLSHPNAAL